MIFLRNQFMFYRPYGSPKANSQHVQVASLKPHACCHKKSQYILQKNKFQFLDPIIFHYTLVLVDSVDEPCCPYICDTHVRSATKWDAVWTEEDFWGPVNECNPLWRIEHEGFLDKNESTAHVLCQGWSGQRSLELRRPWRETSWDDHGGVELARDLFKLLIRVEREQEAKPLIPEGGKAASYQQGAT